MSKQLKNDQARLKRARGKGQSGKRKPFSPEAFARHDAPAVVAVLEHLERDGIWATFNEDPYGPDIVVWQGFRPCYYIEVEQRSGWSSGVFPTHWDPVNIPERKGHLFRLGMSCELWVISMDLKFCLVIPDGVVKEFGRIEEFSNRLIESGENFIRVPREQCTEKEIGP